MFKKVNGQQSDWAYYSQKDAFISHSLLVALLESVKLHLLVKANDSFCFFVLLCLNYDNAVTLKLRGLTVRMILLCFFLCEYVKFNADSTYLYHFINLFVF